MYLSFSARAQGDSHKEKDIPCQDAVFTYVDQKTGGLAIVADGHGSEKHFRSDVGSALAVTVAHTTIVEFLHILNDGSMRRGAFDQRYTDEITMMQEQLAQLERTIITRWRSAVLQHFAAHPLSEREQALCTRENLTLTDEDAQVRVYGTTLIAALAHSKLWFVIQIGDGKCVVLDDEGTPYFPPELDDESLAGGQTTSLCDSDAAGHFRCDFGFERIKGITVATDGVSDSFLPEEYLKLNARLFADFLANHKKAQKGVEQSIAVWSTKGSRDDVSMAGVFYKNGLLE
ncbi:MAG: protein phosphatase 2C domain-containing protein [Treponema sp.]|jgi:serine/threonine protein phosphatase PrpC|nr:protein phosphatase 2C domain-containing protein [Treponema sp.]